MLMMINWKIELLSSAMVSSQSRTPNEKKERNIVKEL
jgi:hypothetical protein